MECEYAECYELACAMAKEDPFKGSSTKVGATAKVVARNRRKGSSTKAGATAKVVARNRRRSKLAKKQRKFNRR